MVNPHDGRDHFWPFLGGGACGFGFCGGGGGGGVLPGLAGLPPLRMVLGVGLSGGISVSHDTVGCFLAFLVQSSILSNIGLPCPCGDVCNFP